MSDVCEVQAAGMDKCKEWLENCCITDEQLLASESRKCESDSELCDCISTTTESSSDYSQIVTDTFQSSSSDHSLTSFQTEQLQSIMGQNQNVYENILISNSKKIHLGNITVIKGPVYLNDKKHSKSKAAQKPEDVEIAHAHIRWIDRRAWLSQPPERKYEKLKSPAKFVVICHSATEDANNHAENILLVRYIQQFHIECRKWDDIAYNFLIGCDGYVYKGRGWGTVGAHTFRYNSMAVGICFVGTFCNKLPPASALAQAKLLINYGVAKGKIQQDYILIGNCQTSSSKSPGQVLYDEIKTWPHYDGSINLENPSPLIQHIE